VRTTSMPSDIAAASSSRIACSMALMGDLANRQCTKKMIAVTAATEKRHAEPLWTCNEPIDGRGHCVCEGSVGDRFEVRISVMTMSWNPNIARMK